MGVLQYQIVMLPFVRTIKEATNVIAIMKEKWIGKKVKKMFGICIMNAGDF